jgi:flavin reductase (DIM6/NTAB) family NADH-FMN oxidoreductase RutF
MKYAISCFFADVQGVEWFSAQNKCPVLKDAIAYMECKVVSRMETADHWITYAQVTNGEVMNTDERTAVHRRKVGNYY